MQKIEIKNLSVCICKDGRKIDKINNQEFTINPGDAILLSGPNGSGKSSIIKVMVGDTLDFPELRYEGEIYFIRKNGEMIKVDENEKNRTLFLKNVCYISQNDETPFEEVIDCFLSSIDNEDIDNKEKYVFDFVLNNAIYSAYFDSDEIVSASKSAKKLLIKLNIFNPTLNEIKTALFLKSKKKHMSGGQAKLLNIASNLVKYKFCKICFLDEPLNNLDYSNVRLLSNLLTNIQEEIPELAFVIVSHCRAIQIINRIVEIDTNSKALVEIQSTGRTVNLECSSCFGKLKDRRYV